MKKLLKILSMTFLLICMLSTSAFAADDLTEIDSYGDYDVATFADAAQSTFSELFSKEAEEIESYAEQYTDQSDMANGFNAILSVKSKEQSTPGFGAYNLYETTDGSARCYQVVHFEKNDYIFIIGYDSSLSPNYINVCSADIKGKQVEGQLLDLKNVKLKDLSSGDTGFTFTFDGDALANAGKNALVGFLVVFSVLIFISLIIYCFKFIPSDEKKAYNKEMKMSNKPVQPSPKLVSETVVEMKTTENAIDDKQLVAVITAAISAYEGKSADGFIVRTIKKRNWK